MEKNKLQGLSYLKDMVGVVYCGYINIKLRWRIVKLVSLILKDVMEHGVLETLTTRINRLCVVNTEDAED